MCLDVCLCLCVKENALMLRVLGVEFELQIVFIDLVDCCVCWLLSCSEGTTKQKLLHTKQIVI